MSTPVEGIPSGSTRVRLTVTYLTCVFCRRPPIQENRRLVSWVGVAACAGGAVKDNATPALIANTATLRNTIILRTTTPSNQPRAALRECEDQPALGTAPMRAAVLRNTSVCLATCRFQGTKVPIPVPCGSRAAAVPARAI
jgi:hypothetical protein